MTNLARILGHLLRGRTSLWQCYTNVTWRTCAVCLSWHGRIVADPKPVPSHPGCVRELRKFPVWRLAEHRARGRRMAERARQETQRRQLLRTAAGCLSTDPEESLRLFDRAGAVDVYLPEVEEVARDPALTDPALRARLREILLTRWKAKFATERYERQPELARTEQEAWGVARIKELLP
jgi:hypothetical protein